MRKEGKLQRSSLLLAGALALCLTLMLGMFADGFSIVSHADSKGTITATSAIIRAEASTSSERIGSVKRNGTVNIIGQVEGADGKIWYEVWVDSTTKGYIRSDLVKLDGSAPVATASPATAPPDTPVEVTPVAPVSATVTGGTSVYIRSNASTNSKILAKVSNEFALTVIGQANGVDEYVWYQVNFISDGEQITGFVRSNFVTLSGEVTPAQPEETSVPEVTPEPVQPTEPPQEKEYDTIFYDGEWKLYKPENSDYAWSIPTLLEGNLPTVKTQKTIIIILVILLVAAVSAVGYLIFKLKDVMDSAYFNQVETETLRKRSAAAAQGGGQRVMHTVGAEKQSAGAQGQRPAGAQGQRPAGAQGQRPAGVQGQKPAGTQGQRPAGTQGQRPAGAQGQRPAGTQGQRPTGAQGQKPAGTQGQAAQNSASRSQPKDSQQAKGWQSKNFMTEDEDEFEFEFLNVDENENNG